MTRQKTTILILNTFTLIYLAFGIASLYLGITNDNDNCGVNDSSSLTHSQLNLATYVIIHGIFSLSMYVIVNNIFIWLIAGFHLLEENNFVDNFFEVFIGAIITVCVAIFSIIWTVFTGIYIGEAYVACIDGSYTLFVYGLILCSLSTVTVVCILILLIVFIANKGDNDDDAFD